MRLLMLVAGLLAANTGLAVDLFERAEDVRPLLPGMSAPSFNMKDVNGNDIAVKPEQLEKPVVLTFYRGGWCPYCNLHLAELRTVEDQLQKMGYDVWFISADRPDILHESLKEKVDYKIYSDATLEVAAAFGIGFKVDDETIKRYQGFGIDLEAASGEVHHGLPAPATFIIGANGIVQFQYTNPDYTVRLPPQVLLAAAEAYQGKAHERLRNRRSH